jgi:hypothetical protein
MAKFNEVVSFSRKLNKKLRKIYDLLKNLMKYLKIIYESEILLFSSNILWIVWLDVYILRKKEGANRFFENLI